MFTQDSGASPTSSYQETKMPKITGPKSDISNADELTNIPKPKFMKMDMSRLCIQAGFNFRRDAKPGKELINSVKEYGVISPILVRTIDFKTMRVAIVDGHRRFNAALAAGLKTVPVMYYEKLSDLQAMALAYTGTDDALPLTRAERCIAFEQFKKKGMTEQEMSQFTGRNLTTVREYLAVEGAAPAIKERATKPRKEGGIDTRTASKAAKLPKESQEKIAPELAGKGRKEGAEIIQKEAAATGTKLRGPKPVFGPKALQPGTNGVYHVAPDFAVRLQEIERRTRLKITMGKGVKAVMEYTLLVVECLKGNIKLDDIDGWQGIKG
jgi:ParB/RepB/Spo0J family partition protein